MELNLEKAEIITDATLKQVAFVVQCRRTHTAEPAAYMSQQPIV
jgi:hypothetical protein